MTNKSGRTLILTTVAAVAFLAASNAHAVFLRGQPFTPAGANFSMFAVQGINPSAPTGISNGVSPQVNGDFEFQNSIGVAYDKGGGQLQNFGLGLYKDSANQVQSTGLWIKYNQPVDAFSVKVTLEDFDIHS